MAYFSLNEDFQRLGSSCGGQCQCGPCRQRHSGRAALAEWYEIDEDEEPPKRMTAASAPRPTLSLGIAPAAAAPAAAAGLVEAALAAIAVVLSAMAAAYLLIRAYEEARRLGVGVELAAKALSAGIGRLVSAGRAMARGLHNILEWARRITNPNPRCQELIALLIATLSQIEKTLAQLRTEAGSSVPRVVELRRLMGLLTRLMNRAKVVVKHMIRSCPPFMN